MAPGIRSPLAFVLVWGDGWVWRFSERIGTQGNKAVSALDRFAAGPKDPAFQESRAAG